MIEGEDRTAHLKPAAIGKISAFTANWLRLSGRAVLPSTHAWLERLTLAFTLIAGVLWTTEPNASLTAPALATTALLHAARLSTWRGLSTISDPLLFILHVAYAWLPIGYALLATTSSGLINYPSSVSLHALTAGAIGTLIMAMISRVALGHTGRALRAARLTVAAYIALTLSVIFRLAGPLVGADYAENILWAGALWASAFLAYLWHYWRILLDLPVPREAPEAVHQPN